MKKFFNYFLAVSLVIAAYSNAGAQCALVSTPITTNASCTGDYGAVSLGISGQTGTAYYAQFPVQVDTVWADTVLGFSSQYSPTNYSAQQILGEPNVPTYYDNPLAWLGSAPNQKDWISVGFGKAVKLTEVNIYETQFPGAIDSVFIRNAHTGDWTLIWDSIPFSGPAVLTTFSVTIPATSYLVDGVRFTLDGTVAANWIEYDAISIIGEAYSVDAGPIGGLIAGSYQFELFDSTCAVVTSPVVVADSSIVIDSVTVNAVTCALTNTGGFDFYVSSLDTNITVYAESKQFGSSIIGFSSQYNAVTYAASQILGAPDVYPAYGDNPNAWTALTPDSPDWIEIGYSQPDYVNKVDIYETFVPGSVDSVWVRNAGTGDWNLVWTTTPAAAPTQARIVTVNFPTTGYLANGVRVHKAGNLVAGWNEFDAVSMGRIDTISGTTLTGVGAGNYSFVIENSTGCTTTFVHTLLDPPACNAPTALRTPEVQDVSVKLDWQAVCDAYSYKVLYKVSGTAPWLLAGFAPNGKTSFEVTGLSPATRYRFVVRAHCTNTEWSDFSNVVEAKTLAAPCAIPTALSTAPVQAVQARINWGNVSGALKYRIRWREQGSPTWNTLLINAPRVRTWLTGLSDSTTYEWQIKSVCDHGISGGTAWSPTQQFTTNPSAKWGAAQPEFGIADSDITLYPNPTNGQFTLDFGTVWEVATVEVRNVTGQVVAREQGSGLQQVSLELPAAAGVYFVTVAETAQVFRVIRL